VPVLLVALLQDGEIRAARAAKSIPPTAVVENRIGKSFIRNFTMVNVIRSPKIHGKSKRQMCFPFSMETRNNTAPAADVDLADSQQHSTNRVSLSRA
jgi:hypothetical protein